MLKTQSPSIQVLILVVLLLAIFVVAQSGLAQSVSPKTSPKVVEFSGELRIDREVTLTVTGLSDWARDHDPQRLVLYLNGRPLKHAYPEQIELSAGRVRFHLREPDVSQPVWWDLLHEPKFYRPVAVSVGLEDQPPFETVYDYGNRLNFTVIPKVQGVISIILVLVSIPLFFLFARFTDILRERGPRPPQGKARRYSLSRVQTAFWFFLVSLAYFCLWLITGDFNTLTPSVLALTGINALAAVTTPVSRPKHNAAAPGSSTVPDTECAPNENASRGFFRDLLSNAGGYSIHRFQMAAWNIVFGIIFIRSVYHQLVMPNFSTPLLLLMGISAVIFIGFESLQHKVFQRVVAAGR